MPNLAMKYAFYRGFSKLKDLGMELQFVVGLVFQAPDPVVQPPRFHAWLLRGPSNITLYRLSYTKAKSYRLSSG